MSGRGVVTEAEAESIEVLDKPKRQATSSLTVRNTGNLSGPTPRRFRVSTLRGIAREMGTVYREMRLGITPPETGSKLVYALSQMAKVVEVALLEQRIEALEKRDGE
jgi:hypothetical protein